MPGGSNQTAPSVTGALAVPKGEVAAKLKVFISYSRADTTIADEIVSGLDYDGGFDVWIDRHDIHEGEEWKKRLGALIANADTIVFILTATSAASPICRWEVEHAKSLQKRIVPLQAGSLANVTVPEPLSDLNYVRFDNVSFMTGLLALRRALKVDIGWLREHTRLQTRAEEWREANHAANRLLTGDDIAKAKTWLEGKPKDGLQPTEVQRDFIKASDEAEVLRRSTERKRAERLQKLVTRTRLALLGAVIFAVAAGVATLQLQQMNTRLDANVAALEASQRELAEYYGKAGQAIRGIADLRAQTILSKYQGDTTYLARLEAAQARVAKLTDADLAARLDAEGRDTAIQFEVGSKDDYERLYAAPNYQGLASGVTIGFGYDLGYATLEEARKEWQGLIPDADLNRLLQLVGLRGEQAQAAVSSVSDIKIPWPAAVQAFDRSTALRFSRMTLKAYPLAIDLPPKCFSVLWDLTYNRGASFSGERRQEIRAIRDLLNHGEYLAIPEQIRAMRWIWGKDLAGLHRRREIEADMFQACAMRMAMSNPGQLPPMVEVPAKPIVSFLKEIAQESSSEADLQIAPGDDIRSKLSQEDLAGFQDNVETAFGVSIKDTRDVRLTTLEEIASFIETHYGGKTVEAEGTSSKKGASRGL